jgi:ABC-type transporter MlaC component
MRLALVIALTAALTVPGPWPAAVSDVGPWRRTRQVLEQSSVIVKGPGDRKQKLTALSELLRDYLDTEALARLAAGKHLEGRSDAEVKEFLSLFHEFFVRTYTQRLLLFDAPDFAYGAETVNGDTARVATEVVTSGDRFAVDYKLRKTPAAGAPSTSTSKA